MLERWSEPVSPTAFALRVLAIVVALVVLTAVVWFAIMLIRVQLDFARGRREIPQIEQLITTSTLPLDNVKTYYDTSDREAMLDGSVPDEATLQALIRELETLFDPETARGKVQYVKVRPLQ